MQKYNQETVASQTAQQSTDWLAIGAIAADVFVTIIVIAAMLADRHSATVAVLSGVVFFVLFGSLVILTLSGTLKEVIINGQNQGTARRLYRLQYEHTRAQRLTVVDPLRTPRELPAPTTLAQLPDAHFVPAIPRTSAAVRADAGSFVSLLFDEDTGKALPHKITPVKKQIQHKAPSDEAVEYLLALEIVRRGDGGQLYWNSDEYTGYPTVQEALYAISTGVRKASWQEGEGLLLTVGESATHE